MRRLGVLVLVAPLLAACGAASAEPAAEPEPAASDLPECSDIWVVGQKLPEDYRGCVDKSGAELPSDFMNCGNGSGWGDEYLYWHEDGALSYVTWSATEHDYPVEWVIDDGKEIGRASGERLLQTSLDTCMED